MSYTYNRFKDTTVYGVFKNSNNPNGLDNANATFDGDVNITGTVSGVTSTMVGLGSCDNTSDVNKPVSTAQLTAFNLKANLASPIFTGAVSGITSTMVGLGNCDNTSDVNKPVSTAQLTAFNLKADLASPALTGTPTAPTAAVSTNNTQIATTAFVLANTGGIVSTSNTWTNQNTFSALTIFTGSIQALTAIITPTMLFYISGITSNVQVQINSILQAGYALLASPAFSGVPTCPTASTGTNTTQIASTAFVLANAGGVSLSGSNTFTGINNYNNPAQIKLGNTVSIQPSYNVETFTAIAQNTTGIH